MSKFRLNKKLKHNSCTLPVLYILSSYLITKFLNIICERVSVQDSAWAQSWQWAFALTVEHLHYDFQFVKLIRRWCHLNNSPGLCNYHLFHPKFQINSNRYLNLLSLTTMDINIWRPIVESGQSGISGNFLFVFGGNTCHY